MKYNRTWIAWLMLITVLLVTVYAAFYIRSDVDKIERAEFNFECNEISDKIIARLHAHALILRSGAAYLSVSDTVTREQWKAFIEESSINKNLPGIQGTGFSLIVPGDKLQQHIKQIRDEGFPGYTIRPEGKRETYTSIIFLEPFTDRNQRAFGYDMFSEPVRREAMERARDMDVAALSGKVMLVQETETDVQAGNLMYVPVYRKGAATQTVEQRSNAIRGWVYSPYRMNDLMAGVLEGWKMQDNKKFYLHIFDGMECTPQSMLFESHPPEEQHASENIRFSFQIPVDFNGHHWILQFTQGNKNIFYNYVSAWVALLGGTFISFLLFFLVRSFVNTENRAQQIAEKLTSELKEKERLLLESQEVARLGSYSMDLTTGTWKSSEILDQIFGIDKHYDRSIEGWGMLIHRGYRELMTDYFTNTVIGKKQPFDKEYKILKKDGEERWVHGLGKLEFDKDNNPVRMLGTISDITKRKEAAQLLQEKEERLRMTVIAGNVGLWSRNLNTNESYFSPEWKNQLGYAESELQNTYETWESLFHPDDLAPTLEKLKASLTTPWPPYEVEFRLRHKNGSYRWILSKGSIQFDENGKPTYMLGSHIDITEQKNAENEIQNLSRFNRRILENIGEGIYGVDVDGNCTFINPAGANMLGCTAEELIGVPMHANHHYKKSDGSVYEKEHCHIYKAFTEGKMFRISDEVFWHKNGTSFPVEYTSTPIYENGKITGAVVVYKDITEQKRVEGALREKEERLRTIIDTEPECVKIIAPNGKLQEMNKAGLAMLEAETLREAQKHSLMDFLLPKYQGPFMALFYEVMNGGTGTLTFEVKGLKGTLRWLDTHAVPIRDANNNITGVLAVTRDITRQKQAEEKIIQLNTELEEKVKIRTKELEETNAVLHNEIEERSKAEDKINKAMLEAEQANRAKSEFLSRMSHELRTPMNSILGFAQLMKMGELKASHKKGVDHIINSGKHLLYLINEVLDISKIEAGHVSLSIEPVEICRLMQEIKDIVNPLAAGKQITVEINTGNNLFVKADLRRLKQVLLNLANNAIKYNHPNGFMKVNCELTQADGNQHPNVRINISDSGVGITPEDIKKLFNPFERIGAEKTETEGTGLGLVVVKKLVGAMRGKVGVESEFGKGSTFWVELPLAESQGKQLRQKNVKEQAGETTRKGGTVLYIEDNNSNIELVEQILNDHRNLIRFITNKYGANAVQLASKYKPDLILLDLNLPDIHGSEVLTKLLANPGTKSIPVVIISADAMEKQVEKLLKIGAKGYLTKPLDVIQFLKVIDEYMSKSDDKNYLNNSKNV